jgi:hypothetical protein
MHRRVVGEVAKDLEYRRRRPAASEAWQPPGEWWAERAVEQRSTMSRLWTQKFEQRVTYTCMLWNVRTGQPSVVTVLDERDDRWVGQRCRLAMTAFEAQIEMFMKSDWRRAEKPSEEPKETLPAPKVNILSLRAFTGTATP